MIGDILKSVTPLISEFIPDADLQAKFKQKLALVEHEQALAQIEVNKVEAAHKSVFVSGWRPALGWVFAAILLWTYLIRDMAAFVSVLWFPGFDHTSLPDLNTAEIWPILLGMLGLGGLRTFEKAKKVARS